MPERRHPLDLSFRSTLRSQRKEVKAGAGTAAVVVPVLAVPPVLVVAVALVVAPLLGSPLSRLS